LEIFSLAARYEGILDRIKAAASLAGRSPEPIRLMAVTKTVDETLVSEAHHLGMRDFGESRVQEAVPKQAALSDLDARWHFIGHLQTNKVKRVVGTFSLIHSVDSYRLAEALSREATARDIVQPILVQVNIAGEARKHGLTPDETPTVLDRIVKELPGVTIQGLMMMAPYAADPEATRPYFKRLRQLRDQCVSHLADKWPLEILSMGMSQDYEVAVEEGATIIRIGSGLFGPPSGLPRTPTF